MLSLSHMKKCIIVLGLLSLLTACSSNGVKKYSFYYLSSGNDYKSSTYYSDEYFLNPSTEYNPHLATQSISFAMASFASSNTFSSTDYTNRYKNAESFLLSTGYSDVAINDDYKKRPETDTFGVVIAKKQINDYTLLAIGTRGAGYDREWASNFTIGLDGNHNGFYNSSEIVFSFLKTYISTYNIKGKLKIWMSGYSRAGAITNVFSGRLDEYIKDNPSFLNSETTIYKEDFYSYCFEAPQGVYFNDEESYNKIRGNEYNNIFNLINYNDPVPKVTMTVMGFTRYGTDIYLSSRLTDINYEQNIKKVVKEYRKLQNIDYLGNYKVDDFKYMVLGGGGKLLSIGEDSKSINWTMGLFLEKLLDDLYLIGVKTRENFVSYLQQGIRDIFNLIYTQSGIKDAMIDVGLSVVKELVASDDLQVIIDDITHFNGHLTNDLMPIINTALLKLNINAFSKQEIKDMITTLLKAVTSMCLNDVNCIISLFSVENAKAIASAHYPELSLSHLRAMDDEYRDDAFIIDKNTKVYKLTLNGFDGDIVIKNGEEIIARYINGEIDRESTIIPFKYDSSHNFTIYLPNNGKYEVSISKLPSEAHLVVTDINKYGKEDSLLESQNVDGNYHLLLPSEINRG